MKLEIGKQYKARGGWRAVVVKKYDESCIVWHDLTCSENQIHSVNGRLSTAIESDYDLISEWTEPRKGEFWVNVYENPNFAKKISVSTTYPSKQEADNGADDERIACVRVEWTEGEGLEGEE